MLTRRRAIHLALLAGSGTGALALPTQALAHANLDAAVPGPGPIDTLPDTITLTFTELLDRSSSAMLYDVNGTPVDGAAGSVDPGNRARLLLSAPLVAPGPYTVGWTSVSAEDGHDLSSFYALLVGGAPGIAGSPAAAPQPGGPASDLAITLAASPDAVGVVQWTATINGPSAGAVQRVSLRFTSPLAALGIFQVVCEIVPASGAYGTSLPMALAGDWQIEAIVRRLGVADDLRVPFVWTARAPAPLATV